MYTWLVIFSTRIVRGIPVPVHTDADARQHNHMVVVITAIFVSCTARLLCMDAPACFGVAQHVSPEPILAVDWDRPGAFIRLSSKGDTILQIWGVLSLDLPNPHLWSIWQFEIQ